MQLASASPSLADAAPLKATSPTFPTACILAAAIGLLAAWTAAGSIGLLAHPLRHGLTWVALALTALAAWPIHSTGRTWVRYLLLALAVVLAVVMIASPLVPVNVLAVALVLLALAHGQDDVGRTVLLCSAETATFLAMYRWAYASIPLVWYAANGLGEAVGRLAGLLTAQPLWVGATFGGVDYLVSMIFLVALIPLRLGARNAWPGSAAGSS